MTNSNVAWENYIFEEQNSKLIIYLANRKSLMLVDNPHVLPYPLAVQVLGSYSLDFKGIRLEVLKAVLKENSVRCFNLLNAVLRST